MSADSIHADRVVLTPRSVHHVGAGSIPLQVIEGDAVVRCDAAGEQAVAVLRAGDVVLCAEMSPLSITGVNNVVLAPLPLDLDDEEREFLIAGWFAQLGEEVRQAHPLDDVEDRLPQGLEFAGSTVDTWTDASQATQRYLDLIVEGRRELDEQRLADLARVTAGRSGDDAAAISAIASAVPVLRAPHQPAAAGTFEQLFELLECEFDPAYESAVVPGIDPLDSVALACEHHGHVARFVMLTDQWWKSMASRAVVVRDGQLTVVVPTLAGSKLVDPATGASTRINASIAESIDPRALVLVPQLPREAGMKDLFRLALAGSGRDLVWVAVLAVLAGIAAMIIPLAAGVIFNEIVPGAQRERLAMLVIAVICLAFGAYAMSVLQGFFAARIRTRADSQAGDGVWLRMLQLPASFFGRYSVGDVLHRTSAIDTLRQLVGESLVATAAAGVSGLVSVVLLFSAGFLPGMLALIAVVVEFVLVLLILRRRRAPLERQITSMRRLQSTTLELAEGIDRVRVSAAEERAMRVASREFAGWANATYEDSKIVSLLTGILASWTAVSILAITAGLIISEPDALALGSYVVLTTALGQVLAGVHELVTVAESLVIVRPQLEQLRPILDAKPEGTATSTKRITVKGGISLSNVTFRYKPELPTVLKNVSLTIRPGESVAIVGPSGAGKSTLLRLLLGFDQPEQGVVAYDGQDLARLNHRFLRRQLGTVLQQTSLFPATIGDNIRGATNATQKEIWAAAAKAGVEQDIRKMPMKLQTLVGHGSSSLSGGQEQRILIARALVGQPKILLFDEATSALDNVTQQHVADSLAELNITRILIAHRLSSIRTADRIIVMNHGRIEQVGTFDELTSADGLFARLASRQLLT
ncbi:MAG: ATP-binding cassette domain-containing protein [Candidatus Nanopelagicales bacterium]